MVKSMRMTPSNFCKAALLAGCFIQFTAPAQAGVVTDFAHYTQSSDWNALILGDVVDYSNSGVNQTDIEGAVAIAGDLTATGGNIPSLTIGAKLATLPGYDASQTTLVVGGNATNRNNVLHGSAHIGGNADLGGGPEYGGGYTVTGNLTVGGDLLFNSSNSGGQIGQNVGASAQTLVGGNAEFGRGSNVFGDLHANGNIVVNSPGMGDTGQITAGGTYTGPALGALDGQPTTTLPNLPVDFSAMDTGLKADSAAMKNLYSDPCTQINACWQTNDGTRFGTILDATSHTLGAGEAIVFDLGDDPSVLWKDGFFIDASEDRDVIINIGGLTHSITNFAFTYSPILSYENVIFNFYDATDIFLGMADNSSGIGIKGNIFAPFAHVYFYNGLLEGNLVAAGLTGNGQINWMGRGEVPEPPLMILILLGLGITAWRRRGL